MSAMGFLVTEKIEGAHAKHPDYPLYPKDLLVREPGGTWTKEAPGLAICGFVLKPEQEATLEPVTFSCAGLSYAIHPPTQPGADA